jgi:hypothetical protein
MPGVYICHRCVPIQMVQHLPGTWGRTTAAAPFCGHVDWLRRSRGAHLRAVAAHVAGSAAGLEGQSRVLALALGMGGDSRVVTSGRGQEPFETTRA